MTPDDIALQLRQDMDDLREPDQIRHDDAVVAMATINEAIRRIGEMSRRGAGANSLDSTMAWAVEVAIAAKDAEAAVQGWIRKLADTNNQIVRAYDAARGALQAALAECGDPGAAQAETEFHVAYLTAGRPSVEITDEAKLPATFWREKLEPNKQAILALLRAGQTIPGAALKVSAPALTIRTKEVAQ